MDQDKLNEGTDREATDREAGDGADWGDGSRDGEAPSAADGSPDEVRGAGPEGDGPHHGEQGGEVDGGALATRDGAADEGGEDAADDAGVEEPGHEERASEEADSGEPHSGAGSLPEASSPESSVPGDSAYEVPGEDEAPTHRPARSGAAAGAGAARAAAEPPEDLSTDSFGVWLRRQREMREIDLREIAEQTKISLRYLKAMEQDRFDVLPAPVFARGFLREYSRYVGLNPDEVVNFYLSSHENGGEETLDSAPMTTESRGPVSGRLLIALLLLLVLAAAAYLWFYQRSQESGAADESRPPMAAPASSEPEPPPEPVTERPPEVPAAPLVVTLDFTQKCWVEARADDQRRVSRLFAAGESLQLEGQEQVVLESLGNVAGVQVQVNGEPFELPEARGNSVRNVVIEAPRAPQPAAPRGTAGPRTATAPGAAAGNAGTAGTAGGTGTQGGATGGTPAASPPSAPPPQEPAGDTGGEAATSGDDGVARTPFSAPAPRP